MPLGRLAQVLRGLGEKDDRLVVGPQTFDDAGVVRLGGGDGLPAYPLALVQTVDYFPPVVDEPWFYGAIAAANALSDVYAMGGRPLSALTLAGFPKDFEDETIAAIFDGGFAKVREAGAVVAGGHTVEGDVHFGFAVTGTVDPERVTDNAHAARGDALYLTKAIGMGTLTTAAKQGRIGWDAMRPAAVQMATLNAAGAEAMVAVGVRCATDVTGFGLLGHARNVAAASGVTLRIEAARVPVFDGALAMSAEGVASGGSKRNRAALEEQGAVAVGGGVDAALARCAFDSETSGGLLIAVAAERAADLERELAARDVPVHRIGAVVERGAALVELA